MKIELEFNEEMLMRLEDRLADRLTKVLENRAQVIQNRSVKLTRAETAKKLRISLPTLDKYIKDGMLKEERAGHRVLIDESEVENFLKRS